MHKRLWGVLIISVVLGFVFSTCSGQGEKPSPGVKLMDKGSGNGDKSEGICVPKTNELCVGASKRDVTPYKFELIKFEYLDTVGASCKPLVANGADPEDTAKTRCGRLMDKALYDCGNDMLCVGEDGYPGKDADGSESDGVYDFFYDCGRDRLCPEDEGYAGPDADGTEGNGVYDTIFIAGNWENRPPLDVHDPVWARAAVFSDGKKTVAFVVLDFIGVFYDDVQDIVAKVEEKVGEGAIDKVIVSATHNHNGPDTMGLWGLTNPDSDIPFKTGVSEEYQEFFKEEAALAVKEAYEKMKSAKLKYATFYTNRDDEWGLNRDTRDPVILDDTASVMYFEDSETGETITTLLSWACHPEALSGRANSYTSDFPHYWREAMESGLDEVGNYKAREGLGGVAIYVQSALGGQVGVANKVYARDGTLSEDETWQIMQAVGERLAEYTFIALQSVGFNDKPLDISFYSNQILFDIDNINYRAGFFTGIFPTRQVFDANGNKWDSKKGGFADNPPFVMSEVVLVNFGGVVNFLTGPGELHPELMVGGTDFIDEAHGSWTCGKYTDELLKEGKCQYPMVSPENENPPTFEEAPPPPYIRDYFGDSFLFFIGLGMDEVGYFVAPFNYELNEDRPYLDEAPGEHYEETNSLGPKATPTLLEQYKSLLCPIKETFNLNVVCE